MITSFFIISYGRLKLYGELHCDSKMCCHLVARVEFRISLGISVSTPDTCSFTHLARLEKILTPHYN